MIGIIGAMDIEIDGLKSLITNKTEEIISGITFSYGKISGRDVVVAKSDTGKVNAALCAEAMILKFSPEVIVNTGVAGCLAKGLSIGEIVIADEVCQYDFDTSPLGDPVGLLPGVNLIKIPCDNKAIRTLQAAGERLGIKNQTGVIASGDRFVADTALKDFIISSFSALACEMEGASIGQICYLNNIPFAVLRALSDSADEGSCEDYPSFCRYAADCSIKVMADFIKNF